MTQINKKIFLILCFLVPGQFLLPAWEFQSPYGFALDLPDGWEILNEEDQAKISFTDSEHVSVLQVTLSPADSEGSAGDLCSIVRKTLSAAGDSAGFYYNGFEAVFADFTFSAGPYPARGYFVFLHTRELDYVITAFTAAERYQEKHDYLLSCLDSFSPDCNAVIPGPVSAFYDYTPSPEYIQTSFPLGQSTVPWKCIPAGLESSQLLIEREARILIEYENDRDGAWQRYYRLIYRDNFHRLKDLSRGISEYFQKKKIAREDIPEALLEELQRFPYSRTGTLSDMLSPLTTAIRREGDCDSRGLLYAILLNSLGYETILLVSSEYSHSMAAVRLNKPGAVFTYDGHKYLVAELTESVSIGMIDAGMADPAKWVPVDFPRVAP